MSNSKWLVTQMALEPDCYMSKQIEMLAQPKQTHTCTMTSIALPKKTMCTKPAQTLTRVCVRVCVCAHVHCACVADMSIV